MRYVWIFIFLFALLRSESTHAACSTPTGSAGQIRFTSNVMYYCNDTSWLQVSMATGGTATGLIQINVPTTTTQALVLKTTDNNTSRNLFEILNSSNSVITAITATGYISTLTPSASNHVATKGYVDSQVSASVPYRLNASDGSPTDVVYIESDGKIRLGEGEGGTLPSVVYVKGPTPGTGNTRGADMYFEASNGTGTGGSGDIFFRTADPGSASPSLTHDATSSGTVNGATSKTLAHTVAAQNDRILLVTTAQYGTSCTTSSVTYNGSAMTSAGSLVSGAAYLTMWYLVAPATGANNVVANFGSSCYGNVIASSYYNVHQGTPLGTVVTNTGNSTALTVNASSAAGELVVDAAFYRDNSALTVHGSQTQQGSGTFPLYSYRHGLSYEAGAATTTMSWTGGGLGSDWYIIAVPLKPANGATGNSMSNRLAIKQGGNVGIGTTAPNAAAILDLSSTTKAFLPPRVTTTERNAISSPVAGLVVYNTTTGRINHYNASGWQELVTSAQAMPTCSTDGAYAVWQASSTSWKCSEKVTYASAGSNNWVVPTGVTSITVKAWGAGGGGCADSNYLCFGGGGGYSTDTIAVTPGETLTVIVGGGGTTGTNGANGGGTGGTGLGNGGDAGDHTGAYQSYHGGGGGAGSGIKRSTTILVVAGGGGGSGQGTGAGAGGGTTGADASGGYYSCGATYQGKGGTSSAGGAAGTGGTSAAGDASGTGNGGAGGLQNGVISLGGGGGGYHGGGGGGGAWGSYYCAGGGGSGYVSGAGTTLQGSGRTPANNSDPDNLGAGTGGTQNTNGSAGKVVIIWTGG